MNIKLREKNLKKHMIDEYQITRKKTCKEEFKNFNYFKQAVIDDVRLRYFYVIVDRWMDGKRT